MAGNIDGPEEHHRSPFDQKSGRIFQSLYTPRRIPIVNIPFLVPDRSGVIQDFIALN